MLENGSKIAKIKAEMRDGKRQRKDILGCPKVRSVTLRCSGSQSMEGMNYGKNETER